MHTARSGPAVTASLSGELDLASAPHLRQRLMPPAPGRSPASGNRRGRVESDVTVEPGADLVVDAAELSFVDVAGLDALIDVAQAVARGGGRFVLHRPARQLRRLIRLLDLEAVLPVEPAAGDGVQRGDSP